MGKLYKIKSVSDVITNSSTEVFVMKINDDVREVAKKMKYNDLVLFETKDDVKRYMTRLIAEDDLYSVEKLLEVTKNDFDFYSFKETVVYCKYHLGKTPEEVYDFFEGLFDDLVGHAWVEMEDDNFSTFTDADLLYGIGVHSVGRV